MASTLPPPSSSPAPPYSFSSTMVTPTDYHKLASSVQLPLPEHKFVGLLACQRDPLLQTLRTTIVSSSPSLPPPAPPAAAKNKKDTRKPSTVAPTHLASSPGKILEIELLDSCLFPEGGGQPSDSGSIRLVEGGDEGNKVLHVLRKGLRAVHFVQLKEGEEEGKFSPGKEVELVVDWARRMDHMTHHTSQHLLSALFDCLPSTLPTLSWSLTPFPNPCYIEIPRAPTPEELAFVEEKANRLIRDGTRVFVEVEDQERKALLAAEGISEVNGVRVSSSTLPKDYAAGVIRTIEIEGVDRNPCCGTHTPSLSLLQQMHLFPTTTPHTSTTRRLYFLTSTRLSHHLLTTSNLLTTLSSTLGSCPPQDLPDRVAQLNEASRNNERGLKGVKAELGKIVGRELKGRFAASEGATKVVWEHREAGASEGTTGTDFLGVIAAEVGLGNGEEEPKLLILSGSPTPFVPGSTSSLHLSGSVALVVAFGERVKQAEVFKGRVKGGGAKGKWQAKVEGAFGLEEKSWIEGVVKELNA